MVSPGRVTAGNLEYYSSQVADGAEEYFSGCGIAQATWIGALAPELGVSGRVEPEQFRQVMAGFRPGEATTLAQQFARRKVLGIDMVFSAPKSVSVMWVLAPAEVRRAIEDAHDQALLSTFAMIEEHCAYGRQGAGGVHKVKGEGLIASTYHHITSRESDPQLHTHVPIANMIKLAEDKWASLDTARLFYIAPTASKTYSQHLRNNLTQALGVEWDTTRHGLADIKGFPAELIENFSKRSRQIKAAVESSGHDSPQGRQVAALITRKNKQGEDHYKLVADWMDEASTLGYQWFDIRGLCNSGKVTQLTHAQFAEIVQKLGTTDYLTRTSAHFSSYAVLEAAMELAGPTVPVEVCQQIAKAAEEKHLLALSPNDAQDAQATRYFKAGTTAFTTPEMFEIEQRAIELVNRGEGASNLMLSDRQIDEGLAEFGPSLAHEGYELGTDQVEMLRHILGSGNTVDAVVGDAGTGKTFTLNIARQILEATDHSVIGAALSAAAALELYDQAQMKCQTIASLLWRIDNNDPRLMANLPDAIVIDEAAMVGTRDTARLIEFSHAHRVKLVFIGDAKQLPAIEAGGMFSLIDETIGSARLTTNRRQKAAERVEIVDAAKEGNGELALALTHELGALHVFAEHQAMLEDVLTRWGADLATEKMILAATRDEVEFLNFGAQAICYHGGELSEEKIETDLYTYRVGDDVLCRKNQRKQLDVFNGLRGRVIALDEKRGELTILTETGNTRELPREYVENRDHLQLGYAMTTHSSQGSTFDRAYVALSPLFNRQMFYTAISRARLGTEIFATAKDRLPKHEGFEPDPDYDAFDLIKRAIARDERQTSATGMGEVGQFSDDETPELVGALGELRTRMTASQSEAVSDAWRPGDADGKTFVTNKQFATWKSHFPHEARLYYEIQEQILRNIQCEAHRASSAPPPWALQVIGPVPATTLGRVYWRKAYAAAAYHRARFGITGPTAFGPRTDNLAKSRSEARVQKTLDAVRTQIGAAPKAIKGARL